MFVKFVCKHSGFCLGFSKRKKCHRHSLLVSHPWHNNSSVIDTCDSPAYLLHPAQESYLGISFLRRLLLSLTDSLPKTLVSGYSYHRASIKHYYIITFYLKKPDLFYNSFHLIIPSKIPNAILRTTDIRLIAENTLVSFNKKMIFATIAGTLIENACGRITDRNICKRFIPNASADSICSTGTASSPLRKLSAM